MEAGGEGSDEGVGQGWRLEARGRSQGQGAESGPRGRVLKLATVRIPGAGD